MKKVSKIKSYIFKTLLLPLNVISCIFGILGVIYLRTAKFSKHINSKLETLEKGK